MQTDTATKTTALKKVTPTCMCALVDLEILTAGKDLATAGEGTRERLFPSVDTDVVDQLVLGLEGATVPLAVLPVASMVHLLGASHVLHRDVSDDLVHGVERLAAGLLVVGLVRLNP